MHKLLTRYEKEIWFLLPIVFVFILLRLPSLFEPYWYGDEGIYQTIGIGINQGRLLYKEIWDNKPPLLYVTYALFHGEQFTLRLVSLFFGLASIITFYGLVKKLFAQKESHIYFITTALFAYLFAIPYLEGNIANAENFMLFPTLLAGYFLLSYADSRKPLLLILAGLLLSTSFLFKTVGLFDFAAFALFTFIITYKNWNTIKRQIKNIYILPFTFALPILVTALFFIAKDAFLYFYQASFTQMIGYVGYGNSLIIPQGLLILKTLALATTSLFIFIKRDKLTTATIFILLWFIFSLFNAFFAGRSYTHYMLVLLPSFSLYAGLLLSKTLTLPARNILIVLFICVLFVINNFFHFYNKTIPYYKNFISFMTNQKSVSDYQAFFDRNTPKDYAVAQFINMHANKTDTIFIWGNNAQLYKLTNKLSPGRFTVAYHMTASQKTLKETETAFYNQRPKFIIVAPQDREFPFALTAYNNRIIINDYLIYERTY